MNTDTYIKSPQLHLLGRFTYAHAFNHHPHSLYLKFHFHTGDNWKLLAGTSQGQTFEAKGYPNQVIIQHPFQLHYASPGMRGWPRLLIQVWIIDSYGRNTIAGYGTAIIPMKSGYNKLSIPCWVPKGSWFDQFIGAGHELVNKGMVISSGDRYGLNTTSTGKVNLQIEVVCKDFNLHGVKID